eukprot:gene20633-21307_t
MGRKRRGIPGLSFSWKRATGVSAAKGKLSRAIGVPLTQSGRRQKVARALGGAVVVAANSPSIPIFDIDKICHNPNIYGTNQYSISRCLNLNQNAYDYIKFKWAEYSYDVKNKCLSQLNEPMLKNNPEVYSNLAQCLDVWDEQDVLFGRKKLDIPSFQK